jgi:RNA polymerase sigma-70 factor (ECF subfamily)
MTGEQMAETVNDLVIRARAGDLDAYGRLVQATQTMAYAVAVGVVRDRGLAEDVVQDAYLRAFRRLHDLDEPAAFIGWFRRIVITIALNMRRAHRRTLLQLDDVPEIPVLDEAETRWTDLQRHRLAGALLTLSADERRLCDRRYHGGWSMARLAREAGVDESVVRKRLQRIREKLRKDIEMSEQRAIRPEDIRADLPAKIVELLARPRLTDLPESPVGTVMEDLRRFYGDFEEVALPEIVDFSEAQKSIGNEALYIQASELHRVDDRRILRYDLTLPLLLSARFTGTPLRLWAAGKTYRACQTDATHLVAFQPAEVLCVDERVRLDPWEMTGRILKSVDGLFPGRQVKIVPVHYPMCTQAWELEIENDGRWYEALAWGVFTDTIVRHIGADPAVHSAIGVGHGLERLAMLRYGIDDIRKIDGERVA